MRAGFYLDGPALIFGQNVGQDGEPFIGPAQAVNEADHRLLGEAHQRAGAAPDGALVVDGTARDGLAEEIDQLLLCLGGKPEGLVGEEVVQLVDGAGGLDRKVVVVGRAGHGGRLQLATPDRSFA